MATTQTAPVRKYGTTIYTASGKVAKPVISIPKHIIKPVTAKPEVIFRSSVIVPKVEIKKVEDMTILGKVVKGVVGVATSLIPGGGLIASAAGMLAQGAKNLITKVTSNARAEVK